MFKSVERLGDFDLLEVSGVDAAAFLQSLLSNDLSELDGQTNAQWTALLSPQGRVIALMALIRQSEQGFLLAVPRHFGASLLGSLRRYVLRRQVKLQQTSDLAVLGSLEAEPSAPGPRLTLGSRSGRHWYLAPATAAERFPLAGTDWRRRDLEDGLAFLDAETSGKFLAAAIGLPALPALSIGKGCYPGQEIVTRSHYLGKQKRHLALLEISEPSGSPGPRSGASLHDPEGSHLGDVVAAETEAGKTTLLASLTDAGLVGKLLLPCREGGAVVAELRRVFEKT